MILVGRALDLVPGAVVPVVVVAEARNVLKVLRRRDEGVVLAERRRDSIDEAGARDVGFRRGGVAQGRERGSEIGVETVEGNEGHIRFPAS